MNKEHGITRPSPDDIYLRKIESHLAAAALSVVFRPGDRRGGQAKGFFPGQLCSLKTIEHIGADWADLNAVLEGGEGIPCIITGVALKPIKDITPEEFSHAGVIRDKESLRLALGLIYNKRYDELDDECLITVIRFSHMDHAFAHPGQLERMLEESSLAFARNPRNNPQTISFRQLMITLIEHDYPGKTPAMWNALYGKLKGSRASIMLVADTEDISELFEAFRNDPRYIGGGLGIGFKDTALPYLDDIDPIARQMGSVNFVVKIGNRLKGYNTDGHGYAAGLEYLLAQRGEALSGKRGLVLGAGGTSRAIAFALAEKGVRLLIVNRTVSKAQAIAGAINGFFQLSGEQQAHSGSEEAMSEAALEADIIINTTTKGAAGEFSDYSSLALSSHGAEESLISSRAILEQLPKHVIVSDVILREGQTPLLKQAAEAGLTTQDGVPMVVNQGVEAAWLLHGEEFSQQGISKKDIYEIFRSAAL